MSFNRKLVANALLAVAKAVKAEDYRYDPEHKHKPQGGGWQKTEKGWSKVKKEDGGGNVPSPAMTEKQKTLERLSQNEVWKVRRDVAKNTSASPQTLDRLSQDEAWKVLPADA